MSAFDLVRSWSAVVAILAVLVGLCVRGRLGACAAFSAYLMLVLVSDTLIVGWPQRFWRRDFWVLKEGVLHALKLAIGLELMVRIFRHFPGAYAAVQKGVFVVVWALGLLAWYSLSYGTDALTVVGKLYVHISDGTVWLLTALGLVSLWYHLPLDSIHKAILIGFVPYLLVYSVVHRFVGALGTERGDIFNSTAPLAYLVLLAYWARVAWKRHDDDEGTRVRHMMPPPE
jgi:hypothetical protein